MNTTQLAINTVLDRHLSWRVCIDGIDIAVNIQPVVRIKHRTLNIREGHNRLFSGRKIKATELHTDVPLSDGRDSICFLVVTPTGQRIRVTVEPEETWDYVDGSIYKGPVMDEYGDVSEVYKNLTPNKTVMSEGGI